MPAAPKKKIWDRQTDKGEGQKAYELALIYFDLGPSHRTIANVSEKSGRTLGTVSQLCQQFEWVKRANAYDTHLLTIAQKAIEKQTQNEAVIWAKRQAELRHESFALADELLARGREMLAAPLYETIIDHVETITVGNQTIEVPTKIIKRPVRWGLKDMTLIFKLYHELKRSAVGIADKTVEVNVTTDSSPEANLANAKAAFALWKERDLDKLIERVLLDDPNADPDEIRANCLAEAPQWFCDYWGLPNASLLTEGEPQALLTTGTPLPLDDNDLVN